MKIVGKIGKTHGVKGQLNVFFDNFLLSEKIPNAFFINIKGAWLPHFVADSLFKNEEFALITFEEYANKEKAQTLVGAEIAVQEKDFVTFFEEEEDYETWIDYTAFDGKQLLGVIEDIYENGPQFLAKIIYHQKEVLIPLVDEMIESVDDKKKIIVFNLPEGLVDVFLE